MSTPAPAANPAQTFYDADCWVEALLYVPSLAALSEEASYPDLFAEDFVESAFAPDDHPILKAFPRLAALVNDEEYPAPADVVEALHGARHGFFVKAATPVRQYLGTGGAFASGGSQYWEWLYAATEADIAPVVAAWAEAKHAADKAKAA